MPKTEDHIAIVGTPIIEKLRELGVLRGGYWTLQVDDSGRFIVPKNYHKWKIEIEKE
jgi:hypothetical protein